MGLVLIRIDDRMIHGQVVEGWARQLKIAHILLANDEASRDEMKIKLCCMAVPGFIKISVKSIDDAVKMIENHDIDKPRTLLLVSNPSDILALINKGVEIKSVNVGGMHHADGKWQILKYLSVSAEDVRVFRELDALGIEIEGRAVPSDEKIQVIRYL